VSGQLNSNPLKILGLLHIGSARKVAACKVAACKLLREPAGSSLGTFSVRLRNSQPKTLFSGHIPTRLFAAVFDQTSFDQNRFDQNRFDQNRFRQTRDFSSRDLRGQFLRGPCALGPISLSAASAASLLVTA